MGSPHGKPLVVQGESGFSAVLEPDNAALLARSSYWSPDHVSQPEALLARHLLTLVDDEDRRRRLGEFSRTFAEQRFGLTAMAEKLVAVYETALTSYTARSWWSDLPVEARRVPDKLARTLRGR